MQKTYSLLVLLLMHFFSLAQANEYTFKHITSANGLPQNYVRSVIQDSRGFMWLTTFDGIVRYDGYSFKAYRRYDNGLDTGLILYVTEDPGGNLWIGTETGIYRYDIDTDIFTRVSSYLPEDSGIQRTILKIKLVGEDQVWVYTGKGGIYRINVIDQKNNKYQLEQYLSSYYYFPNLCVSFNGYHLTVAEGKVYAFDEARNTFERFQEDILENIDQIFVYKEQLYLLKKGLAYLYNEKTSTLYQLTNHQGRELFISSDNQLWLSSFDGLYRTSLKGLTPERTMETVFSGNPWTTSFTEDTFGNIWIGTYRNGAYCFHKNQAPFQRSLSGKNIECISTDNLGNYWIGSLNGEVCVLDSTQRQIIGQTIFPNNMIHSICKQKSSNRVWIGTMYGLYEAWIEDDKQICFQNAPGINIPSIRSMVQDSCFMWIASYNNGLTLYNTSTQQQTASYTADSKVLALPSNTIRTILKDKENNLWIGTAEGLVVLDGKERFTSCPTFRNFSFATHQNNLLFKDNIVHIQEAANGDIWVGTLDNGLYYVKRNPSTNDWSYQWINVQKGLSNNCIKTISEDNDNFIWVATNKGLNRIDPKTLSIKNYQLNDGLANNEFCEKSYVQTSSGTLYFGGINGITSFTPSEFTEDTNLPKVSFTNLSINNNILKVGEEMNGQIILKRSILNTNKLTLSSRNNNFSLDFVGLKFSTTDKTIYKYKLEGFDNEWITCEQGNRSAKYTNIPPGNYLFSVKASCNGEIWSEPLKMEIQVLQPLLLRWYFIILYILIGMFIVYLIIRNFKIREKRKSELFLAQKEKQQIRELSEMKMNFFMNLSHEFRTPLTLIISPLQKILSTPDISKDELYRHLMNIQHNSSILLRLINQMLKLSKEEKGKLDIKLCEGDIVEFCRKCFSQFHQIAQDKRIQFVFNANSASILLLFDAYKMEEILYNLLSNAIKHTPDGGSITLDVLEQEKGVSIHIADSGTGMTEEVKKHIFERFYSETGVGIGLSLTKILVELHKGTIQFKSTEGEGTVFQVFIPFQSENALANEPLSETIYSPECSVPLATSEYMHLEAEDKDKDMDDKPILLIVDDNKGIVQMLDELFCSYYKILTAFNGKDAFELCLSQMPSLVISDIYMPEMNGIELCSTIKTTNETSHIPVVLLTAKTSKEVQQEGLSVYADAYCSKPFDNDILISTVHSIIANRQMMAQKFRKKLMSEDDPTNIFPEKTDRDFLQRIIKVVEENIANEELSVSLLCRTIGMSQLTLNKKIKQLTNQTTNAFIRSIRLKVASQMILSQKYSISEVTYAVGFSDLRYFRECFKKEFGVLPSDYKK